jgi:hypothetical protein
MISLFIIFYNLLRVNKSKISWLNLDNGEGVTTALGILIVDVILFLLLFSNLI